MSARIFVQWSSFLVLSSPWALPGTERGHTNSIHGYACTPTCLSALPPGTCPTHQSTDRDLELMPGASYTAHPQPGLCASSEVLFTTDGNLETQAAGRRVDAPGDLTLWLSRVGNGHLWVTGTKHGAESRDARAGGRSHPVGKQDSGQGRAYMFSDSREAQSRAGHRTDATRQVKPPLQQSLF